jgi:UDP-N-acetylmuramoyl-tripeptide--D-alanyl-D-alanine ligase
MENFHLHELINAVKGEFLLGDPHLSVDRISTDTRTIHKGNTYFALSGKNFDGHLFLKEAIDKGASILVISKHDVELGNPFPVMPAIIRVADTTRALGDMAAAYRKKFSIPLVAITGTNGKTTTKQMLASILEQRAVVLATEGNFNNQIGLPLTLLNLSEKHSYAVIEMGTSYHGEIKRLCEIARPSVGIITNIGVAHLNNFVNQEGVYLEKKTLLENLPTDGCAVLNIDDHYLAKLQDTLPCKTVTFGLTGKAQVSVRGLKLWPDYPQFDLVINQQSVHIKLPVYGHFNVYNAMAAAAAAFSLGMTIEEIQTGLQAFKPAAMRMEVKELLANNITVINDAYNANPSSMREAISSLYQSFTDREILLVLGDMLELGVSTEEEHKQLGEFLKTQPNGKVLFYGPLMLKAFEAADNADSKHFTDMHKLLAELERSLAPGMVVFFKGSRGMKLETAAHKVMSRER